MEFLFTPEILAGLATLIVLEVVLGIDNLVFIAILADKLPPHQRDKARLIGLSLALVMRLVLLASISWIIGLTDPVFAVAGHDFSWRDIILITGGAFLLVKATMEIHERLEGHDSREDGNAQRAVFGVVIAQIVALDAVFSLDAVITAVGMVDELWVMMTAVTISMVLMLVASKPLTAFVGRHPTVIILCLSFLLLIGLMLVLEGFGFHVPKGYLYAAIGFAIVIEGFNQISTRNRRRAMARVPMRQRAADGIYRLLGPVPGETPKGDAADEPAGEEEETGFQPAEQEMIRGVIELADQPVRAIMTPRSDIFWLDVEDGRDVNLDRLIDSGRTRVLLARESLDQPLGIVETRAALSALIRDESFDLSAIASRPLIVSDSITALRLIELMRATSERFALVADSDGNIDGVVTGTDIFAAIAGDLAEDEDEMEIETLEDGTLRAGGSVTLDELSDALGREQIGSGGRYTSLAGFLLFEFGRMPGEGETIVRDGLEFTVHALEGNRIEWVEVRMLATEDADAGEG